MNDRTRIWIGRISGLIGGVLGVGGLVLIGVTGYAEPLWKDGVGLAVLLSAFFAAFVWLVIPNQPRNPVVWSMVASGVGSGLYIGGYTIAAILVESPAMIFGNAYVPAEVPVLPALLVMIATGSIYVGLFSWVTFGLLLFPDGKPLSPKWRWVVVAALLGLTLLLVAAGSQYRPGNTQVPSEQTALYNVGGGLMAIAVILSLVSLILRFRRSSGAEREQFKWVVWGAAIFVPWIVAGFVVGGTQYENLVLIPIHIAAAITLAAYGIAVAKYRLFDIDVVISKTMTYLSLAVVIAILYVSAVFGLVLLFGHPDQRGGGLGSGFWFGATVLVAIVFEPLRVRLQRWANRLAYGARAEPHEVLSQLTAQLSAASRGEGLIGLARLLREGTGSERAVVWLRVGQLLRVEAVSATDGDETASDVTSEAELPASEVDLSVPVRHGGELLGALGITKPRSHPITPADEVLLADVAAGAGLLLRNRRLNAELAARAVQLRTSRRRLIAAHDAARHRLERDLHDGAQQQVVALKVRLGLTKTIAEREGAHDLAARVADLADGTQQAVDAMRMVARGIYPPLLDAEGLVPALTTMHRSVDLPLQLDLGTLPRHSKEVEETVYFCVLGAVTLARMAGATSAQIEVRGDESSLTAIVSYDSTEHGDLTALADRVEAFGGTVTATASTEAVTIALVLPVAGEIMEPA